MRTLLVNYEWMADALCRETGGEPFFSNDPATTRAAKRLCEMCDVQYECLEYALKDKHLIGVFGGTTERERGKIRKKRSNDKYRQAKRVVV